MARVGDDRYRCARCGDVFPMTEEFFYLSKSGPQAGRPSSSYCRSCKAAWFQEYWWSTAGEPQKARRRLAARSAARRARGITPDRYRPSCYVENRIGAA
jgi:hypothetical protein